MEKKLECFVPAMALEHEHNGEYVSRYQKIRLAIIRLVKYKDYFSDRKIRHPLPKVYIEKYDLDQSALGYQVLATIK